MTDKKLTPAQQTALDAENEREKVVAFTFLAKHPTIKTGPQTMQLLAAYLKENGLPFELDALEDAYGAMPNKFPRYTAAEMRARAIAALELERATTKYPWGNEKLTRASLRQMSVGDLKKYGSDPEFQSQISAL